MRKLLGMLVGLSLLGCGKKGGESLDADLARFVAAKRAQTQELADAQTNSVPGTVWKLFDAIQGDDWNRATNLFEQLRQQSGPNFQSSKNPSQFASTLGWVSQKFGLTHAPSAALDTELWSLIVESLGTYEQFHKWDSKWLRRFGRDIINSIPSNNIYFGGTDPGRFVISALSDSHRAGRPFFTLTQNALADSTYLEFLRTMYGHAIYIPPPTEAQQAFQEYLADAERRMRENPLESGEDVQTDENRVRVGGAAMDINGRLVKVIVDKNPSREIYVEESFSLDWMYPQLSPHGLILKLNREPLAELSEDTVGHDRDYWKKYAGELIGDWITDETSVKEVCDFGEKVFLRKDLAGFKGDVGYARNEAAQKAFSKLRSSIAGLYAWRAQHAKTETEKQRMTREADLAFRQALALCPYSPEAVYRYVDLLLAQKRNSEARLVAQTFQRLSPADSSAKSLMEKLETN